MFKLENYNTLGHVFKEQYTRMIYKMKIIEVKLMNLSYIETR